jgi:hypothetical protein
MNRIFSYIVAITMVASFTSSTCNAQDTTIVPGVPSQQRSAAAGISGPSAPPDRTVHWIHGLGEHGIFPTVPHFLGSLGPISIGNPLDQYANRLKRNYWNVYGLSYGSERRMLSNVVEYSSYPGFSASMNKNVYYSLGCDISDICNALRQNPPYNISDIVAPATGTVGYTFPPAIIGGLTTPAGQAKPILIGHSTGGIIARSLDFFNGTGASRNEFGGIITIGSPNEKGAPVVRSIKEGLVDAAAQKAMARLLAPAADPWISGITIGGVLTTGIAASVLGQITTLGVDSPTNNNFFTWTGWFLGNATMKPIRNIYSQVSPFCGTRSLINDLDPGPPSQPNQFLAGIEAREAATPLTPRISLVGNAYQQEHFRLLYSFWNPPVPTNPLAQPYTYTLETRDNTDDAYLVFANILAATYGIMGGAHALYGLVTVLANPAFIAAWIEAVYHIALSVYYISGAIYINPESQWDYLRLIGAAETQRVRTTRYFLWIPYTTEEDIEVRLPNDGLFSEKTQTMKFGEPITRQYRTVGANHFTENNHPDAKRALDFIFDRNPRFIITKRIP